MSQSLSIILVHLNFSTKDRQPWLGNDIREKAHAFLLPERCDNATAKPIGWVEWRIMYIWLCASPALYLSLIW
jgi:hypothetical protein